MAGKAQNESDTSHLDELSRPGSSPRHHRPGHRRAHHHGGPHRHSGPHHHGESHQHGEVQDSPDNANPSTSFARAASRSPNPSHPTYDKAPLPDEHHRDSRRHLGRSPHQRGSHTHGELRHHDRPSPSKENFQDGESADAYVGNKRHHHLTHHLGSPPHGGSSPHPGPSSYSREHRHHHRRHHREHGHREHRHGEYSPTARRTARGSSVSQPSAAHKQGKPMSWMPSGSTVRSRASKSSSKVYPLGYSSKTSETWPGDAQQHRTSRASRGRKKAHTGIDYNKLCENCCPLFHGLRKMLSVLTESLFFDAFIFIVVCLNMLMLVAQTFANVEIRGEWYFMVFDCIFLSIYLVEALLKIITMGLNYFKDSWNNLDFFIVTMAALEFTLVQLNSRSFKSTVYNPNFLRIFKVFRSLRALRAVRVLRRLSFLTSLQEVTGTLVRSMQSITAILVLMFTCLFLFSVVLRGLFRQSDPKRFQNIFTTVFTLFTLLTLDDWSQIYLDSRANGAWYIVPILMIYIIIQYFIFLNLVIAVLVDNFQMALLRGLEKVKQERAAQIYEKPLPESLTMLSEEEPKEVMSDHTKQKLLIEKKFGTMTTKQQELLFHFLQLASAVELYQQKFRSQASVIDEIVDTAFEAGEEDFKK